MAKISAMEAAKFWLSKLGTPPSIWTANASLKQRRDHMSCGIFLLMIDHWSGTCPSSSVSLVFWPDLPWIHIKSHVNKGRRYLDKDFLEQLLHSPALSPQNLCKKSRCYSRPPNKHLETLAVSKPTEFLQTHSHLAICMGYPFSPLVSPLKMINTVIWMILDDLGGHFRKHMEAPIEVVDLCRSQAVSLCSTASPETPARKASTFSAAWGATGGMD